MENNYVKQMLKVLIYIQDHIDNEMTVEELASVACYSPFHFHRVFKAIVGEPVHKYVRRLRLEMAATKLKYSKQPVTDIALDIHFETPSAFTRAFKQCMGASPRNYRLLYKEVNAMTKKINELPMIEPEKIEKLSDIDVVFARRTGSYETSVEDAWTALFDFIHAQQLDRSKLRYFTIYHDEPQITNASKTRCDACINAPQAIKESGEIARQVLKGGRYAIFTHLGPQENIDETFDRIFLKWLPNSTENLDYVRPCFIETPNLGKDEGKLIISTIKIYIPLV